MQLKMKALMSIDVTLQVVSPDKVIVQKWGSSTDLRNLPWIMKNIKKLDLKNYTVVVEVTDEVLEETVHW